MRMLFLKHNYPNFIKIEYAAHRLRNTDLDSSNESDLQYTYKHLN